MIPKRLEEKGAPSGEFVVPGGMFSAMYEFMGRARPMIPLKLGVKGSSRTTLAAAKSEDHFDGVRIR